MLTQVLTWLRRSVGLTALAATLSWALLVDALGETSWWEALSPRQGEFRSRGRAWVFRSSRLEVLCKKGVLKNFENFTGKHLRWGLFFNKDAGAVCNFIKKETRTLAFSCKFSKIFKNTFFYRRPPAASAYYFTVDSTAKTELNGYVYGFLLIMIVLMLVNIHKYSMKKHDVI